MPFTGILAVEMFGGEDMPTLTVSIKTPNGSTIETTQEITQKVEAIVSKVPEIDNLVRYIGTDGMIYLVI